jgi:hypothetical protein
VPEFAEMPKLNTTTQKPKFRQQYMYIYIYIYIFEEPLIGGLPIQRHKSALCFGIGKLLTLWYADLIAALISGAAGNPTDPYPSACSGSCARDKPKWSA